MNVDVNLSVPAKRMDITDKPDFNLASERIVPVIGRTFDNEFFNKSRLVHYFYGNACRRVLECIAYTGGECERAEIEKGGSAFNTR